MKITKEIELKVVNYYLAPHTLQDTAWTILGHKCTKATTNILNKYQVPKHTVETVNRIMEQKYLQKYGVKNPSSCSVIKEKRKQTSLAKYGVENVFQAGNIKNKIKETCLKRYGVDHYNKTQESKEKHRQTNLKKYGVDVPLKSEVFKLKSKQTCLRKYGVDNYTKTDECKLRNKKIQKETTKKQLATKRKNNTFNCSTDEKKYLKLLQNKFGNTNVISQYKETRYPYLCDFYIKSKDLFIELNFIWTHGGKKFTGSNNDLIKLNLWKEKAKKSRYYQNAIDTWTIRDVQKNNTAQKNKLNYLVFYSQKEIDTWLAAI